MEIYCRIVKESCKMVVFWTIVAKQISAGVSLNLLPGWVSIMMCSTYARIMEPFQFRGEFSPLFPIFHTMKTLEMNETIIPQELVKKEERKRNYSLKICCYCLSTTFVFRGVAKSKFFVLILGWDLSSKNKTLSKIDPIQRKKLGEQNAQKPKEIFCP